MDLIARPRSNGVKPTVAARQGRRPSQRAHLESIGAGRVRADRYELRQATVLDLIQFAYAVDGDTVFGGPSWLNWDRFDLVATIPSSTTTEAIRQMLQAVLAARFKLVVHQNNRPMPVMVLSAGKGKPKLKAPGESSGSGCQSQQPPRPAPDTVPYITATCRDVTMESFATSLRRLSPEYITIPAVDTTGLRGTWDFDLRWTPKGPLASGRGGISLPDAIDRQLGLKLQEQKRPMPVLVIDSVTKLPGATWLRLCRSSSKSPPSSPVSPTLRRHPRTFACHGPGGRITWRSIPLRELITQAFDLDPDPHAAIPGAPKWLQEARFDLIAKAPGNSAQLFAEDLRPMLRALLIERFQMRTHYEDRPVDTYTRSRPSRNSRRPTRRIVRDAVDCRRSLRVSRA